MGRGGSVRGPRLKAQVTRRKNRALWTMKGKSSLLRMPPQPVEGSEIPCHLFSFFSRYLEDFFFKLKRLLCNYKTWRGGGMLGHY